MQHFNLVSSRNGVLCSHPYLCARACPLVVVQSKLVSPSCGRGWWLLVGVVPNLYKQRQGERRGKPLKLAGKASANAKQSVQVSACSTGMAVGEAAACGSGDAVTGWASPGHVQSSLSFIHFKWLIVQLCDWPHFQALSKSKLKCKCGLIT